MPDITSGRWLATVGSMDTFSHTEYLTQSSEYHSLLSSSSGQSSPPDLWKQLISSSSAVSQPSIESASTQQGFLSHQCFWPHMRKHDSGGEERREKWVSGSPASFCINYGTLPGLLQMYNPNRFSGTPSEAIISEYVWKCLQNHKSPNKWEIFKSLHNGVTKVLG